MTEGEKVHRLLGCMYKESKKAVFYDELLEDFNGGLWFGRIQEKELKSLCDVLVRDDLATFVDGTHAAASHPSDRESSKGISVTANAYTAYINAKYLEEGGVTSPLPKIAIISLLLLAMVAVGYLLYLQRSTHLRLEESQKDFERAIYEKEKAYARMDSIVAAKDSLISKQKKRISDLEKQATLLKSPPKKTSRRR